jgi:hypothetical protein
MCLPGTERTEKQDFPTTSQLVCWRWVCYKSQIEKKRNPWHELLKITILNGIHLREQTHVRGVFYLLIYTRWAWGGVVKALRY